MRSSFSTFVAAVLVALTVFFAAKESQAYRYNAVYDPVTYVETGRGTVPNHNAVGGVDRIYMNRNQILLRITGCEYGARVTSADNAWDDGFCDDRAGNPRHWTGSGMEFIESIVNDKLLGATINPVQLCNSLDWDGVCGGTMAGDITVPPQYWRVASGNNPNSGAGQYYDYNQPGASGTLDARFTATNNNQEPIFRNYLDLLLKRFLDGDLTTPLDYDTYTFRYVDSYNPAFTVPIFLGISTAVAPTTTDTNGDGIQGGWEPDLGNLIAPFCVPDLIVIGPEVCFNLNIVNLDETLFFAPRGPWGTAITGPSTVTREVNNVGAPMIDYDRYLRTNQAGTSHLFLASQPKRTFTFDSEIVGCTSTLITSPGNCNESPYRDDDDGLYVELKLVNFTLDLLFEPPFTDTAYGVSSEVWGAGIGRHRHRGLNSGSFAASMTGSVLDIPSTGSAGRTTWPCPGRANDGKRFVHNVTNEEAGTYVAACDLSRWLKIYGPVRIPELTLGLSVRLEISYGEGLDYSSGHFDNLPPSLSPPNVTGPVVSFGFDLEFIEFSGQFAYNLIPGPFCNDGDTRQGQDYRGIFYDQTDVPKNCEPRIRQPGSPSIFDDATYNKSVQFASTITFVRAEFLGKFEDFFDPTTNPGFYLGPTVIPGLNDLNDVVGQVNFDWPLAGTTPQNQTDAVWIQLGLEGDVELRDDMQVPVAPYNTTEYVTFRTTGTYDLESGNGDQTNEFWADPWGVIMPMSGGIGFYWTNATGGTAQDEVISCVKADGGFTGYVDGYLSLPGAGNAASRSDDPSVSRPIPNLALNWSGSANIPGMGGAYDSAATGVPAIEGPEYDSMLLHLRIPNVSGKPPFVTAATLKGPNLYDDDLIPSPNAMVTQETYAFGIAIHQNLLSKVIYELVIDGLLCLDINPDAAYQDTLDSALGGLLTTDTLGLFVPYLSEHFAGYNMSMRIVPLLRKPTIAGQNFLPTSAFVNPNYSSMVSQFIRDFTNGGAIGYGTTAANDIPRVIIGGSNQFDSLKKRFRGQIATEALIEYTCGINTSNPLTSPTCGIWPDLSIIIPHLMVEFFINDDGPNHDQAVIRRRAFAMDLGINVGLNIDIIQNPVGGTPPFNDPSSSGFFGDAIPNSRPVYGGTSFPIGCDRLGSINPSFPCDVTGVPSRLVIFFAGLLDPEINSILVYDELPGSITDFTGDVENVNTCIDPMGGTAACDRPTDVDAIASYQAAISNLLGLILSGEISFFAEIGFDPAAYLDLPVVVTIPYIGPSFVVNSDAEAASTSGQGIITPGGDLIDNLACYRSGADYCPDPVFFNGDTATPIIRDISDGDANGFGDYLIVALGLDLQYLDSRFLLRLIDTFVEPLLNDYCDGDIDADDNATTWGGGNPVTDVVCTSESFNSRLTEILASLGVDLAPGFAPESKGRLPVGYQSPETVIKGIRKAHGFETIIEYEGWHPTVPPSELTFSYRVDGGFWTPFVPATTARIPGLFEGRHVFEVRAKDPRNNVEYTPERIEFVVDSVAPRIAILGDRVQRGGAEFLVEVYDAQSLPEDVRIAYKLNDGEWSGFSYDKEIAFSAPTGQHVLRVRAMDESGNVSEQTLTIAIEDGGFGCASTTAGGDGVLDLLLILLVPALVLRARRRIA